jgi:hypothetical protein
MHTTTIDLTPSTPDAAGTRAILARPFELRVRDEALTVATDHRVLVAVRGSHAAPLDDPDLWMPSRPVRDALALPRPVPFGGPGPYRLQALGRSLGEP